MKERCERCRQGRSVRKTACSGGHRLCLPCHVREHASEPAMIQCAGSPITASAWQPGRQL